MPSTLGSAVFQITGNTALLATAMGNALTLVTTGLGKISASALGSTSMIVQGIGLIGVAATAAVGSVTALTAALTGLAGAGAHLADSVHNVEQTFGSFTDMVEASIDRQVKAFGRSRVEMLNYADIVGRELQNVSRSEEESAVMAMKVVEATSRLAEARRITPSAAFTEIKSGAMSPSQERISGMAFNMGLITNPNIELTAGNELLARYAIAVRDVMAGTESITGTTKSWTIELQSTWDKIGNLASSIGNDLQPAAIEFLGTLNSWIDSLSHAYKWLNQIQISMQGITFEPMVESEQAREQEHRNQAEIDKRNETMRLQKLREELIGKSMAGRGGGGGGVGYQGTLAGFHARIQEEAWNQRNYAVLQEQAKNGSMMIEKLDELINTLRGQNTPEVGGGW